MYLYKLSQKKCEKYWPDTTLVTGTITVNLTGEYALPDYTVRAFTIIDVS